MMSKDQYLGCFVGLAIGDALGAPFEGGFIERLLWQMIGTTKKGELRYTDDTQMSLDIARSFLENNGMDQDHLAQAFAHSYHWSRGYGPSAAKLLKQIKKGARWQDVNKGRFEHGSFGNGAAMRTPIVALCCPNNFESLKTIVIQTSEITHAHPLAIEAAQLIAFVTYAALHDQSNPEIIQHLSEQCSSDIFREKVTACINLLTATEPTTLKTIRKQLGNGISAKGSAITAIYFALYYRNQNYTDMLKDIHRLGGDTDTIGAMACAIWGSFNGFSTFDIETVEKIENINEIITLATRLHEHTSSSK